MERRSLFAWLVVLLAAGVVSAGEPLPKVVLLGDSIRLSYAPTVQKRLAGKVIVVSPKANGGDSGNLLKHLDEWVIRERPALVHFNCGIHDTKKSKTTGKFQVPPEQYEANLRKIVERLRAETKAEIVFATTTPILDERAAKSRTKTDYELLEASVVEYNRIARRVMDELKVPVDDLRAALPDEATRGRLIGGDGIHFTGEGTAVLGEAVARFLLPRLSAKCSAWFNCADSDDEDGRARAHVGRDSFFVDSGDLPFP